MEMIRHTIPEVCSCTNASVFIAVANLTDCHYHWYATQEICHILERFDGLVVVGDAIALEIYAGLNTLLREDFIFGASSPWHMDAWHYTTCECEGQFRNPECFGFLLDSSWDVNEYAGDATDVSKMNMNWSPYKCDSKSVTS
jgi:hypothetical protein